MISSSFFTSLVNSQTAQHRLSQKSTMIAKKRDIRVEKIMSTQKKKLKLAVVADDDDDCFSHILTTPACINEITILFFLFVRRVGSVLKFI